MSSPHIRGAATRREFLWEPAAVSAVSRCSSMRKRRIRSRRTISHFAKAQRVIQIFCPGGLSHVDSWDYKPELEKRTASPSIADDGKNFFAGKPGNCEELLAVPQHGQCGRWMTTLFPQLAPCVDDMAFIHSMQSKSALHGPAMFMANSGFILPGLPEHGRVGHLWTRQRERESARLRRAARSARTAAGRRHQLGRGFSARDSSGHDDRDRWRSRPLPISFPPMSSFAITGATEADGARFSANR